MQSIISFILCALAIVLSVQARSIDKIESNVESELSKKQIFSERYYKLLTYLRNHQNTHDNDHDDSSSSSTEDIKQLPKRGFFLFPDRRSNQKNRPAYSYGRKSHWDTFFG